MRTVAVFTDTYLPTVNGVSYTVQSWRQRWRQRGGRMPVVYPDDSDYSPRTGEYPVSSVPFPFYRAFRFARPAVPAGIRTQHPDVVHAHTPFTLGLTAKYFAADIDAPLVVSYHTPTGEYAGYISDLFAGAIGQVADRYERWYFGTADAIVVPSETAAGTIDAKDTPIHVVPNGVDTDLFRPASAAALERFRAAYDLPDGPLVGYTGRHGHEKRLDLILDATESLDVTVVLAGDGPARPALEQRAANRSDVRFLGFLDRETLPVFYTALDAFVFPSPVETQGLVALEAIACNTPVVAVNAGALTETVVDGETGTHFPLGDTEAFRDAIVRTLSEAEDLPTQPAERRLRMCVEHSINELESVYETVLE